MNDLHCSVCGQFISHTREHECPIVYIVYNDEPRLSERALKLLEESAGMFAGLMD